MKSFLLLITFLLSAGCASAQTNLVPDASFEAPVYSWFSQESGGNYFAGKEKVDGAPDGKFVLALEGWEKDGSKVLSAPFDLKGDTFSSTWKVRSFGAVPGARAELALFDEKGEQKLLSCGEFQLNGSGHWSEIKLSGLKLGAAATRGRLALLLNGPQEGGRVEVDQVGFFAGAQTQGAEGPVATDNSDFDWFEAEDMANGKSWRALDGFPNWYPDLPSGMKMLSGADGTTEAENAPASKTLTVRAAGMHRLWMRFLHYAPPNNGSYTVSLRQNGQTLASKEVDDGDRLFGDTPWPWISLVANLQAGQAEVIVSRPPASTSWVARKIDLFALTNMLDYVPKIEDFRPKAFVCFKSASTETEPFCLWAFIHRNQLPFYVNPGILDDAGWSLSYYTPADKTKWIQPGESTPWVNISQFLCPGGANKIQFLATRESHTTGWVQRGFKGTLEFSVGDDHRLVRTVEINQDAPRFLMALPYDLDNKAKEILTSADYIKRGDDELDKIGKVGGSVAKKLDLNVILQLDAKQDDPAVIDGELNILKRLGFNGTYTPLAEPKNVLAFNTKHGLENHLGLWVETFAAFKNGCLNQPDLEQITATFKKQAEDNAPYMAKVERMKLHDEPGNLPYEHFVSCEFCKNKFRADLKARGLTPGELGVGSWDEVVPVLPADKEKHPALFYETGLFRLQTLGNFTKIVVKIKKQYLPDKVKTYVNYSPPGSEYLTWTLRGTDPWLMQRNGLELGWTEDWVGYGATPQQISPFYAQLRAAGGSPDQPLGGYMVGVSGGPLLQRIKYYEMIANGVRHVDVYSYGPYYTSVDSWANNYAIYPAIARVQHELGVIDGALAGTKRHKTDVAILYNRTASIWLENNSTPEQDARYTHVALAHAGYQADFIDEDDIAAGKLSDYKVLYINGVQVRRDVATKIAGWVQNGGVLSGDAGAGSRDEYNRPLDTLNAVFGATSTNLKVEQDAGRPKYEMRGLPTLAEMNTPAAGGAPQVTFNQLCYSETLTAKGTGKVILLNKEMAPTGIRNSYGKGIAIRLAAMPGIAYLNEAIRDKTYDPETYLPQNYRKELRDFIAWPAMLGNSY